jgi:hypothetical protein
VHRSRQHANPLKTLERSRRCRSARINRS